MKKTIIFSLLASVVMLAGCEKNFDAKIYGVLYPDNYPSNQDEYETYTMLCYVPFGSTWMYYLGEGLNTHPVYTYEGGVIRVFDATTDEMAPWAAKGWGSEWKRLSQADYSSCQYYTRSGSSGDNLNHITKLSHVTRFTEILDRIEKADPKLFHGGKQQQLIGEVALCRAMLMYFIYHLYGPMPVLLDPALIDNEEAQQNLVRPTIDEMSQWIYDDIQKAIDNLPESVDQKGRYTKDYARFCMMKHCLNEGDHMPGWYEKGLSIYDDLNTGKYSLVTASEGNPFLSVFSYFNKWNKEIIMAVSNETNGGTTYSAGNFFPHLLAFMPADVSPVDNNGNKTPLWKTGWAQYYNVAPAFYDTYESGDIRRDAVLDNYWVKVDSGLPTKKIDASGIGVSWDGFLIMKWPYETDTPYQGHDWPLARWADVLLMKAELDVRLSGGAPSAEAVECVNEVRRRAGLSDLSSTDTGSREAFLDALLAERGREFLFEGMRKIDLVRFNKYAQNTYKVKGFLPTHQYMPLPNFIVEQAESYGKTLVQTFSRPGWEADVAEATREH